STRSTSTRSTRTRSTRSTLSTLSTTPAATSASGARRVRICDALGVRAAVTLELCLDPVERLAIALGPLAAIAELRQALDRGLVFFEIEPADHRLDRILRCRGRLLLRRGRGGRCLLA